MFLFEKPWLTTGATYVEDLRNNEEKRLSRTKSGLRMLLAVMSMLFFLFVVAYLARMKAADWQPLPEHWLLWGNTVLLLLSSLTMQWTVLAARRGETNKVRAGFLGAGLFAWAFLVGQLWVWHLLDNSGYFLATNPANSFFYMITALHGLHLLGGLGVWAHSIRKMKRDFDITDVRSSIELCTTYWHFLLIVWLVLFSLLIFT